MDRQSFVKDADGTCHRPIVITPTVSESSSTPGSSSSHSLGGSQTSHRYFATTCAAVAMCTTSSTSSLCPLADHCMAATWCSTGLPPTASACAGGDASDDTASAPKPHVCRSITAMGFVFSAELVTPNFRSAPVARRAQSATSSLQHTMPPPGAADATTGTTACNSWYVVGGASSQATRDFKRDASKARRASRAATAAATAAECSKATRTPPCLRTRPCAHCTFASR
mmetsp:Transcript_11725/g.50243  ORF Transcript_11725/g.50243 Transcript_11725/m.50243 type:complete len:227 (+) Transcript_11725:353-1033(+)